MPSSCIPPTSVGSPPGFSTHPAFDRTAAQVAARETLTKIREKAAEYGVALSEVPSDHSLESLRTQVNATILAFGHLDRLRDEESRRLKLAKEILRLLRTYFPPARRTFRP